MNVGCYIHFWFICAKLCINSLLIVLSVFADAHFPSSSICRSGATEVRADGMYMLTLPVSSIVIRP